MSQKCQLIDARHRERARETDTDTLVNFFPLLSCVINSLHKHNERFNFQCQNKRQEASLFLRSLNGQKSLYACASATMPKNCRLGMQDCYIKYTEICPQIENWISDDKEKLVFFLREIVFYGHRCRLGMDIHQVILIFLHSFFSSFFLYSIQLLHLDWNLFELQIAAKGQFC